MSNPTMEINDQVIAYLPNSLSFNKGFGEKNIRAQSAGGNAIEPVITENAESKLSMVKFKLASSSTAFDSLDVWQGNIDGNTIRLSEGNMTLSFRGMVTTTDPERSIGVDGEVEIEFKGTPII
jgi:hypothetical protein